MMSPRRVLVGLMIVGLVGVVVGIMVHANTRPIIPTEKLQPDLDPASATPAEWRAQAERIVSEASAVTSLVPDDKDPLPGYLGYLHADLGEAKAAADLIETMTTEQDRFESWSHAASGPAGVGDVETVEQLAELAPTDEILNRVRLELLRAYANAGEPERAVELYRHPDLAPLVEANPIGLSLSRITAALVRAGKQQQARELLQQAEQQWTPSGAWNADSAIRHNLVEHYIMAHDLVSARRLLDEMDHDDYLLGQFAEQQAQQMDLAGARATRDEIEDVSYRAWSCSDAARHLALAGEDQAARDLFAEAIQLAKSMEPECGYRHTRTNESMLIHIARRQLEGGFNDYSAETARRAFELIEQQHDNEMDKALALAELLELLLEIEHPDLAKQVYDRAASIVSESDEKSTTAFEARIALGLAASELNMPDASAEHFAAAFDTAMNMVQDPDQRTEQEVMFVLQTAVAQAESGQQDAASETFTLATQLHRTSEESDQDDILDSMARAFVDSGRITAALYFAGQIKDPYDRAMLLCDLAAIAVDKAKSDRYRDIHGD